MSKNYIVVFDRELDGRHIASVPGIPGCHAYGRTPAEALRRVKSALSFFVREIRREGRKLPGQPRRIVAEITIAA